MARLGLRSIKKPNLIGSFQDNTDKPVIKGELSNNNELIENTNKDLIEIKTRNNELIENRKSTNTEVIKQEKRTNKPVMESTQLTLDYVSSYQRDILQVIFQEVQANPFDKETRPLNIQQLGLLMGITENKTLESLRIVILRLEKTGFLIKTKVKTGRSGWTCYTLPNQIFEQILRTNQFAKPVIKGEFIGNNIITKPVITDLSKKESINNNISFFIPEVLKKIGLKETMIKTEREDLQDCLTHLAFSVENNELKTTNKLATAISIINSGKNWVAGKLIEQENLVLEEQQRKINELKKIKEQQLKNSYEIYKLENPNFIEEIKAQNPFIKNNDIADSVGFSKFQEMNLEG